MEANLIDNVGGMIRRDWNHPSIILWGVRINESSDDHPFYLRTNALAHALDPRVKAAASATTADQNCWKTSSPSMISGFRSASQISRCTSTPNSSVTPIPPRLPTTTSVNASILCATPASTSACLRSAVRRRHRLVTFDYNTHANFGAGDLICYHGVTDIFREPKPAAAFYKSMCDPDEENRTRTCLPLGHWRRIRRSLKGSRLLEVRSPQILSRESGREESEWKLAVELDPERTEFNHLLYLPFILNRGQFDRKLGFGWGDLRIDGFIKGQQVISKSLSSEARTANSRFALTIQLSSPTAQTPPAWRCG